MKNLGLLLLILIKLSVTSKAQNYPSYTPELGLNFGILKRFHSNVDQGRDEKAYPAYRFGFEAQNRFKSYLGAMSITFETGGVYKETYFNFSGGFGLAIWSTKDVRIDLLVSVGADLSPDIPSPWFRPSFSGNLSFYYRDFKISLASRAAAGILESYSETGITIGYLLRSRE